MQGLERECSPDPSTGAAETGADQDPARSNDRTAALSPGAIASDHEPPTCPARRALLATALVGCATLVMSEHVRAQNDAPGSDERPQKADLLVFADGNREGQLIAPADVPLGGPPMLAWPMDPQTKVVRSGSRLNQLLVVRLDPADLDDDTRPRAAEGILAYSAVCSHAGCAVTTWVKAENGDKEVFKCPCHNSEYDPRQSAQVVFGPAPRRLAALPLTIADQSIRVAAAFIGRVGAQQAP